jgi:hypothetical protein
MYMSFQITFDQNASPVSSRNIEKISDYDLREEVMDL